MRLRPLTSIMYSVAGLVVCAAMAGGCADTRPSMQAISQHPTQDFATLKTNEGEDGVYFWGCRQRDDGLDCYRICDYGWDDDRVCAPELAGEFGRITGPTSGVVAGRYRAKLAGDESAVSDGDAEETDGGERRAVTREVEEAPEPTRDEGAETDGEVAEEEGDAEEEGSDDAGEAVEEVSDDEGVGDADEAAEEPEAAQDEDDDEADEEGEWWEEEEAQRPREWWEEDE